MALPSTAVPLRDGPIVESGSPGGQIVESGSRVGSPIAGLRGQISDCWAAGSDLRWLERGVITSIDVETSVKTPHGI